MLKRAALLLAFLTVTVVAHADGFDVEPSTQPIGGWFYRHLAADYGLDLRELVKLEKRGFGRGEVVTLVLISSHTGVSVKDYAKRRLKDKVLLKDLSAEAGLDYDDLRGLVQKEKSRIEAKGENDLPPPVFEPTPAPTENRKRRKKKAEPDAAPSPSPTPTPEEPT